jgi:hypothetical protein
LEVQAPQTNGNGAITIFYQQVDEIGGTRFHATVGVVDERAAMAIDRDSDV